MSFGTAYATKKRSGKEYKSGAEHQAEGEKRQAEIAKRELEKGNPPKPAGAMMTPKKFADGGCVEEDADMIARIMHKRKEYARGGMVANDVGVAEADESPAEFDDLVLDDHLDGSQPVDSNEHGDEDVSDDPIDRVMLKRRKK
jgi:hypothetical protein